LGKTSNKTVALRAANSLPTMKKAPRCANLGANGQTVIGGLATSQFYFCY
jgi:hypothetical protein